MSEPAPQGDELQFWMTEQERAIDRLRARMTELEHRIEIAQESTVPHAVSAAGILALLLALSLPWLVRPATNETTTAWGVLLAPTSSPLITAGVYTVLAAMLCQILALGARNRFTAIAAATATVVAGLATIALIFTVGRDPGVDAGTGPGVCLVLVLILGVLWGIIAEARRWT